MDNVRIRRLLGGLGTGYLHTALVAIVGLWLTPYVLRHLGSNDYGLWLLGMQVVFYLGLTDLGVIAIAPREIGVASGLPESERLAAVQTVVGRVASLMLWQLPAVALVGGVVIWLLPAEWTALRGPMALVVLVFVVAFPFRLSVAVLQGLQDLTAVGAIYIASWVAGTAATVMGVSAGLGLYSVTIGWAITQAGLVSLARWRLASAFPDVLPRRLPKLTWAMAREQLDRSVWVSVRHLAHVLLSGTDLLIIGKLLGPAAVVPYASTGKIIALLSNQPQMLMQLALPALSELRSSAPRPRLHAVMHAMRHVTLLASGAIVAVVLAANGPFVAWWVGEEQFVGVGLTAILLGGMLLRHLNMSATYALFCLGNERRLALTAIADGIVSVLAMMVLVPMLGPYGAALGPLVGTTLVSLPYNAAALAREEGITSSDLLRPLAPWAVRCSLLVVGLVVPIAMLNVRGLSGLAAVAAGAGLGYVAIMLPVMRTPPLDIVTGRWLEPLSALRVNVIKRLTSEPTQPV